MTEIEIYKDHRMTAIPQPGGGYVVEVVPIGGGKPVLTMRFQDLSDAMAEARLIVHKRITTTP